MNLRDLNYLVSLADYGHFGKAAEMCFVSQPTLSMQIKKIEQELGVPLLERSHKSVLLTEVGKKVVAHAREILQHAGQIREIAKLAQDPEAGEIKLGIIPTLAPYFLPYVISPITQAFPKLALYLFEEQTAQIISKLQQGNLDAGILTLPVAGTEFTSMQLFDEAFMLAVPKGHPLAKQKKIKQTALVGMKLLLLEEGHCLRDQALAVCSQVNALENRSFRATSLETLRHMVTAGMGTTLLPELACREDANLSYIPFNSPQPARTIGVVWRNSSIKTKLLTQLVSLIREIMC